MRKWIHALTLMLMLTLSAASPSGASILISSGTLDLLPRPVPSMAAAITGADGRLAPTTDYTLPYRANGIFDFSEIDLGAGVTLRFDSQMQTVRLLSLGDILIAGRIEAPGIALALETPERLFVTGSISAGSISLSTNTLLLTGELGLDPVAVGGNTCSRDCRLRPASDTPVFHAPGIVRAAVPEPSTLWLAATLFPLLAAFGRSRTTSSCRLG